MPHPKKSAEEKAAIHAELKAQRIELHSTPEFQAKKAAAKKLAVEDRLRRRNAS